MQVSEHAHRIKCVFGMWNPHAPNRCQYALGPKIMICCCVLPYRLPADCTTRDMQRSIRQLIEDFANILQFTSSEQLT